MTETDHQMLGAAAKAAGLDFGVIHQRPHRRCHEGWTPWNPLTDDGDALRLAVALRLNVDCMNDGSVFVGYGPCLASRLNRQNEVSDFDQADRAAATRRAIVRAAAAQAA